MLVLMMPICVGMFVSVHPRFVAMLLPIMRVGTTLVTVFMFMLVFVVAAHTVSPPLSFSLTSLYIL